MDFVRRDDLVAGMHAWILEKAKGLGQILAERGALTETRHDLLERLVQEHIRQHGDDPGCSLASLGVSGRVREDLKGVADPDVQVSLVHAGNGAAGAGDPDPNRTLTLVECPPPPAPRFRILRPHARGGLGEVFVAHDEELNREVALKEIQSRHADDPESRARFLLEAEITGGLEHPGIVPVYGLGRHPDGRPFYAMRFIHGDSLKEAIERFHQRERLRPRPGRAGAGAARSCCGGSSTSATRSPTPTAGASCTAT